VRFNEPEATWRRGGPPSPTGRGDVDLAVVHRVAERPVGQKAKLGGYPHKAPLGYLNVREPIGGRQVAHIVPDPERAPLVKAVFELYATGEWTVERLAEDADGQVQGPCRT